MARRASTTKSTSRRAAKRKAPAARKAAARKPAAAKRGTARMAPAQKPNSLARKAAPLPKSRRSTGTSWSAANEKELRALIKGNTPTRVIGLKLGRSEAAIRSKLQNLGLSLMPANRSPYNRM